MLPACLPQLKILLDNSFIVGLPRCFDAPLGTLLRWGSMQPLPYSCFVESSLATLQSLYIIALPQYLRLSGEGARIGALRNKSATYSFGLYHTLTTLKHCGAPCPHCGAPLTTLWCAPPLTHPPTHSPTQPPSYPTPPHPVFPSPAHTHLCFWTHTRIPHGAAARRQARAVP